MSGNSIDFDNKKKIKIRDFYKDKNKKTSNMDGIDVDKVLVSKKHYMVKIIHLNTLLYIMIMILLGLYL